MWNSRGTLFHMDFTIYSFQMSKKKKKIKMDHHQVTTMNHERRYTCQSESQATQEVNLLGGWILITQPQMKPRNSCTRRQAWLSLSI